MIRITRNRSLATMAVVTGLLVAAAPAVAAPSHVSDGTSNTVMFVVDGPFTADQPSSFSWSVSQTGTAAWNHSGQWDPTSSR